MVARRATAHAPAFSRPLRRPRGPGNPWSRHPWDDTAPLWLRCDRDRIEGDGFQRRLTGMGISQAISAPAGDGGVQLTVESRAWRLLGAARRDCPVLDGEVVYTLELSFTHQDRLEQRRFVILDFRVLQY